MKIIIDTHIFLWILSDPGKISKNHYKEIETRANLIYLSLISIAELMIKASLKKMIINFDPVKMAEKSGIEILDFKARDAILLKELPFCHKDPFDRMLIAQSLANKYYIMTNDDKFKQYECRLI